MESDIGTITDRCPICGNDTRSTPGIRFKINTKCYHRICETCVDRVFSSGKAECPIAGCHKHLWKREWRTQTFEDLQIEREVEIRRKVTRTLDRDEQEFEDKRAYDDFLELREEFIMNLVFNTDVATVNRRLRDYQIANGIKTESMTDESVDTKSKAPRRKETDLADPSGLIKGLKRIIAPIPKAAYDPFMGMPRRRDYYTVNATDETGYEQYKSNEALVAGGYDFSQASDESLLRAFAGLGVFVQDEKMQKQPSQAIPVSLPGS